MSGEQDPLCVIVKEQGKKEEKVVVGLSGFIERICLG